MTDWSEKTYTYADKLRLECALSRCEKDLLKSKEDLYKAANAYSAREKSIYEHRLALQRLLQGTFVDNLGNPVEEK